MLKMAMHIKVNAKFGNILANKAIVVKFNKSFGGKMRRCRSTNRIMNKCKLRGVLFRHYGNIIQNLNNFLFWKYKKYHY